MCMLYFPYQHCQTHIVPEVIYHHALMKKPNFNNYIFGQNMPWGSGRGWALRSGAAAQP